MKAETINSNAFITLYNSDEKVAEFCDWCEIDYGLIETIFTENKIDDSSLWVEYDDYNYIGEGFWATPMNALLRNYKKVIIEPIKK